MARATWTTPLGIDLTTTSALALAAMLRRGSRTPGMAAEFTVAGEPVTVHVDRPFNSLPAAGPFNTLPGPYGYVPVTISGVLATGALFKVAFGLRPKHADLLADQLANVAEAAGELVKQRRGKGSVVHGGRRS